MLAEKHKIVALWDEWSRRKHYNRARLSLYYHIRERNLRWLTSRARGLLTTNGPVRILKTDLWNEVKKGERYFLDAECSRFAVDISDEICRAAKSDFGNAIFLARSDIEFLPFRTCSFDLIWDISTIDHCDHPENVLREYQRVLRPGGILLLIVENPFCLSFPVTKLQSYLKLHVPFKGFSPSRMVRACRANGLTVVSRFKTNIHLPTFVVYYLERKGELEEINQGNSLFWDSCKKYFVLLCRKE
ncbi:MAG: class I SAM-dependent methyltransferase [Candidatus Abyssobacteria bacterium SURF_17]|uniref:Class I SAM-dependent methyltransferase n=1 Tax=Candidatus Abyssobacteria bacterium SURF_17 TaxID=2093361 RepID=A0A419EPX3_9BACT|nr:MAG: class I SAM-dependent methyltransferase [Candidatus Abyssubacteria bacterium SURF_17]